MASTAAQEGTPKIDANITIHATVHQKKSQRKDHQQFIKIKENGGIFTYMEKDKKKKKEDQRVTQNENCGREGVGEARDVT